VSEYDEYDECDGSKRYGALTMPLLVSSETDTPPTVPPSPLLVSGRWATTRSQSYRSATRSG
jgi:hypothetical protein